jgi:TonB family protein
MADEQTVKSFSIPWGLVALVIVFLGAAVYFVYAVLSDDGPRSKSSVTTVTLLKPPPPPQIKEKLPEPEEVKIQQKEEVIETVPQVDQDNSSSNDNTPAGDNLGLDAEGTAGGDGFGLVGKKGGRSLIAGDGGSDGSGGMGRLSLLTKYAGYAQVVENEVRRAVMKKLDENGGIPKGKLQTVAKISVNKQGAIISYQIIGSSGNHKMDDAVKQSLSNAMLSEPPPDGMPRTMTIKISSMG